MSFSRTAIKDLKARYLDVLRKCAYLDAIVVAGSLFAYSASATTLGDVIRSDGEAVFDISQNGTGTDPIIYTVTDADTETIGAGNKIIQGAANTGSTIDPSDYVLNGSDYTNLFDVASTSGKLTVQDLTIKTAFNIINVEAGAEASFNNVDMVFLEGIPESDATTIGNNGTLYFTNTSTDGRVINRGTFVSNGGTIFDIENDGGAELTDTVIQNALAVAGGSVTLTGTTDGASSVGGQTGVGPDATLNAKNTLFQNVENMGTFTTENGSIASLTNASGTASLTDTAIQNTLDVTGGTVTLIGTIDGALSVGGKTTVGADGTLSAINNTIFAGVENAGAFTLENGSLAGLTNASGTASLTDATITGALDVTAGTVDLDGATVDGKTTVGFGTALNAVDVAMQQVINGGSLTIQGGTLGALNVQGLGLTNLTDVEISGDTNLSYSGNLNATNTVMQHVLNEWGWLGVDGGSLASLANTGGEASLTDATITGALDATGGAVSLHGTTVDGKTTVGAKGTLTARNGTGFDSPAA